MGQQVISNLDEYKEWGRNSKVEVAKALDDMPAGEYKKLEKLLTDGGEIRIEDGKAPETYDKDGNKVEINGLPAKDLLGRIGDTAASAWQSVKTADVDGDGESDVKQAGNFLGNNKVGIGAMVLTMLLGMSMGGGMLGMLLLGLLAFAVIGGLMDDKGALSGVKNSLFGAKDKSAAAPELQIVKEGALVQNDIGIDAETGMPALAVDAEGKPKLNEQGQYVYDGNKLDYSLIGKLSDDGKNFEITGMVLKGADGKPQTDADGNVIQYNLEERHMSLPIDPAGKIHFNAEPARGTIAQLTHAANVRRSMKTETTDQGELTTLDIGETKVTQLKHKDSNKVDLIFSGKDYDPTTEGIQAGIRAFQGTMKDQNITITEVHTKDGLVDIPDVTMTPDDLKALKQLMEGGKNAASDHNIPDDQLNNLPPQLVTVVTPKAAAEPERK